MNQIVSIQILRAFAALAVAYGHAAWDASQMALRQGMVFETPFREQSAAGVDLFFVISGFVMVRSSRALFAVPGGPIRFLLRRLARIVPIYWVTTAFFLLALVLVPGSVASMAPSVIDVVKSLFFIPYVRADDGLMQPVYRLGWTLNYEMFFYLSFSGLLCFPARKAVLVLTAIFLALSLFCFLGRPEMALLRFWSHPIILEFVFGALIGLAYLEGFRLAPATGRWLAFAGGALFVFLAMMPPVQERLFDWLNLGPPHDASLFRFLFWGMPAALIVAGLALRVPSGDVSWRTVAIAALGDASYALYLIHPIVIRAFNWGWTMLGLSTGGAAAWVFIVLSLMASAGASIIVFRIFERPVTRWIQGRGASFLPGNYHL